MRCLGLPGTELCNMEMNKQFAANYLSRQSNHVYWYLQLSNIMCGSSRDLALCSVMVVMINANA